MLHESSKLDQDLNSELFPQMISIQNHLQSVERYLGVINEFAVTISTLQTVGEIAWAITNHALSRLDFEDCVVYLVDPERNLLVQKAAYGPKNPKDRVILNPIDIPIGSGIVGSVAQSGRPERVIDTRKDARYIVDDQFRLSELAVPLMFNNQVLGVIDSEHSEIGFFTQRHLNIMMTLASLAAPRIAFIQTVGDILAQPEDEVSRQNLELQNALARLQQTYSQLLGATRVTEEVSRAKNEFVHNISHELRTPLSSIIGYIEMLVEDLNVNGYNDQMVADIGRIEAASRQMVELINKLTDISDIEPQG